jgi:SAM-dependent methyltransferase
VADLGCGSGRWSVFLRDVAGALVLVDFSDAIFVARKNLHDAPHAVFFMADLMQLPFRDDCFDLAFSIGVLHHLPVPCLAAVRRIGRLAPQLLVYLYYALDNRPFFYRAMFHPVNAARRVMSRVHSELVRRAFARSLTWAVYVPLIGLGRAVAPLGMSSRVPLYDFYAGKSASRIEQDVYDRFFTGIEQRVSREQILTLQDAFGTVIISDGLPYWHFLCVRPRGPRAVTSLEKQDRESIAM